MIELEVRGRRVLMNGGVRAAQVPCHGRAGFSAVAKRQP